MPATKTRTPPASVTADAKRCIPITMEEAKQVPNLLGRFLVARLQHHGYYAVTVDGVKTLYTLAEG